MIPRGAKTVAAALHGDYQAAQERQAVLATIQYVSADTAPVKREF